MPLADSNPDDAARDSSVTPRLLADLAAKPAAASLDAGRALALRHDPTGAASVFDAALARHPDDDELCLALAGVRWQLHEYGAARALLEATLRRSPDHLAAALTLARLEIERNDAAAAEAVLCHFFGRNQEPPDAVLQAARMLADAGRKPGAARLCEAAIAAGSDDAFVRVYAGALQGQLGDFGRAREHYLLAIARDARTVETGAAYGLASIKRYADPADPDLVRFRTLLLQPQLTPAARASVLFALGKACDDLGDFGQAAVHLRKANGLIDHRGWSRKRWRRMVQSRLSGTALPPRTPAAGECMPVFVVGAPRSGTTLAAELLGRSRQVRNRGELDWLPHYADRLAHAPQPDAAMLDRIAEDYLARLRQDESGVAWFIDKQPLNFLHLDLIWSLFPQARVVFCRRSARDTALSIWSQHFDSTEYRFAYDFADIAAVLTACDQLRAKAHHDPRLIELRYEDLAREPGRTIHRVAAALGLAPFDCTTPDASARAIGTASVWQARQPVYTRAISRWRAYADAVPELLRFADG